MHIDDLLNKYFEGKTSSEEERVLRTYFSSSGVPEHLSAYQPLFAYFDEEIEKKEREERGVRPAAGLLTRRKVLYVLSGVVAVFLLLAGLRIFLAEADPCLCEGNYVVINGRCYTDPDKIREFAFGALEEVAASADEYFPEADMGEFERNFIENQLKELSSLFGDDD
ncbi:MAG: hypothetical protein LIP04_14905 [Tannerellaceae bacterium]|nr:hypothetical protein [Tannerellaceae bacterium]